MRIDIVTVPYRYDQPADGSGRGPDALLAAGLESLVARTGAEVGPPQASFLPDEERVSGSIAVNVGRLGAHTAELVAGSRAVEAGVLVLSGDDTAMVGVVSGLQQAHGAGARIGLVWLDAHGDFNTPETSYSGILAGMPLAILAGLAGPLWRDAAGLAVPVSTDRIVISGVRDLDEREATLIQSTDVRVIRAREATRTSAHAQAVDRVARTCDIICVHIDLDVLDPSLVPSSSTPEPGGLSIDQAASLIATALATGKVGVLNVAGLNPGGGKRGERSIASCLALLKQVLPEWHTAAGVDTNADA